MSYTYSFLSVRFVLIQDIALLESMQSTLDNVVSTIFDEFGAGSSEIQLQLRGIFEGLSLTFCSINTLYWIKFGLLSCLVL